MSVWASCGYIGSTDRLYQEIARSFKWKFIPDVFGLSILALLTLTPPVAIWYGFVRLWPSE